MRSIYGIALMGLLILGPGCSSEFRAQATGNALNVGAIPEDPAVDDTTIQPCNPLQIAEYYQVGLQYGEGRKSVREKLMPLLHELPVRTGQDGYFTVRFLVNCAGKPARYRGYGVTPQYETHAFPEALQEQLINACKTLVNWSPGTYEGKAWDAYFFVTFKLKDGQVIDLLP
ncbi:MAG: hypothetical protein KDC44_15740 [Phaeodactylibacter sp.]|nr:hypothetical protein [Phaeodactylibacter sp.]